MQVPSTITMRQARRLRRAEWPHKTVRCRCREVCCAHHSTFSVSQALPSRSMRRTVISPLCSPLIMFYRSREVSEGTCAGILVILATCAAVAPMASQSACALPHLCTVTAMATLHICLHVACVVRACAVTPHRLRCTCLVKPTCACPTHLNVLNSSIFMIDFCSSICVGDVCPRPSPC